MPTVIHQKPTVVGHGGGKHLHNRKALLYASSFDGLKSRKFQIE